MEKARIHIRLPQEIKTMIDEAASVTGMSPIDFLESSAKAKAEQAVEQPASGRPEPTGAPRIVDYQRVAT